MKVIVLDNENYIPEATGANVTFHRIEWNDQNEASTINAGGNINYHALGTEGTITHTHEFAEICLVLSGRIKHIVNGEEEELNSGTLLFIRPTDYHRFEAFKSPCCELINFTFSIELLRDFSLYMQNDFFLKRFTALVTPPAFKLSVEEMERIADLFFQINREQTTNLTMAKLRIKTAIAELFTTYFLDPENSLIASDAPEWFGQLCEEMKKPENFTSGLKRMNSLSNCTQEHLCKLFRKHHDKTPTEFINNLRAGHAAKLLADTNETIYSIATDLGFLSISRFYKIFKKHYGISPAKYRKARRKSDIPINSL